MKQGERLLLTDGKGHSMEAEITEAHKKHCTVNVLTIEFTPRQDIHLVIAISLIKNTSRFEWFLEKATELGTAEIIPVICERTEKQRARYDRFINICRSAMLQSSQNWLPVVHPPTDYSKIVEHASEQQKFIAHCHPEHKQSLSGLFDSSKESHIVLIGPEGD
ncbi:MAG TPA: RsmE family RNA methyltransferase, partial [Cyclobacteriaceae bacterium]|nr:RsmE family RNA methyltransferase [Cyclobacteriaceae bacterium]